MITIICMLNNSPSHSFIKACATPVPKENHNHKINNNKVTAVVQKAYWAELPRNHYFSFFSLNQWNYHSRKWIVISLSWLSVCLVTQDKTKGSDVTKYTLLLCHMTAPPPKKRNGEKKNLTKHQGVDANHWLLFIPTYNQESIWYLQWLMSSSSTEYWINMFQCDHLYSLRKETVSFTSLNDF